MKTPPFKARECPKCHDPGPLDVVSGVCQRCHATAAHKAYQVDLEGRLGHLRPTDTSSLKDWETPSVCGKSVMGPDDLLRKCPLPAGHQPDICEGRHPRERAGYVPPPTPRRDPDAMRRQHDAYSEDPEIYERKFGSHAAADVYEWGEANPSKGKARGVRTQPANVCEPCKNEKHDKCNGVTKTLGVCKCTHAKRGR